MKHKDVGTFNVIFNYRTPFLNGPSFGITPYDSISFSSSDLQDEFNRYSSSKVAKKVSFNLKDINFHYLKYEGSDPSKYITQEVQDFLWANNIAVGKNDVTSRWFKIIFENGNKEDYIEAGIMAGTVLNLAIKQNSLRRIVEKVNPDLNYDMFNKVERAMIDYFDSYDIPFMESNIIRSKFFGYLKDKNDENNYERRKAVLPRL